MSRDVLLAAVLGPHGLKGEVRVKTFTATPETLSLYGPLHTGQERALTIAALRGTKADEAVVRFAEITSRDAAEALKGVELFVARTALPVAGADEFYHADLVGLRAEDKLGRGIGTVSGIHNFGAGDVIEIARDDGDSVMLPFTREMVPLIAVDQGRLVIAAPEEAEAQSKGNVE